jgi:hypothetical protein
MDNISFIDSKIESAKKTVRNLKIMCFFAVLIPTVIIVLQQLIPNNNSPIELWCYVVPSFFFILGFVLQLRTDKLAKDFFVMDSFKRFGPPQEIAEQINDQMAGDHWTTYTHSEEPNGILHIINSWLIHGDDLINLNDIIWVYGIELNGQMTGIFCYAKEHLGVLRIDYAPLKNHGKREERIMNTLAYLKSKIPWAEFSYTTNLEGRWKQDRIGFIRDIENRKISYDKSH